MKKIFYFVFAAICFLFYFAFNKANALPNPWVDCNDDISCSAKKAGFNLPLRVENYSTRAMKGMLEITFPIDRKRKATIRKSQIVDNQTEENGIIDISGDYNNYPVNKTVKIKNGISFNVRGKRNKFFVVNFAAESGYYSIMSKNGIKLKDIEYFYKLLEEAEAHNYDEQNNLTLEELENSRRVDGIVEPVFTQDCFPRTLEKKGVTKKCFERANLGQDTFCSKSEIIMIKEYYKKGQDKDPLNSGGRNFCAE